MTDLTLPIFTNPEAARVHLEKVRWPSGKPICPHCGVEGEATLLKGKAHRLGAYQCNACREQFTVTLGMVMEGSHIPLNKWVLAFHLLAASKKGISSHQLGRMLGVSYKSAWFMSHRIRVAMAPVAGSEPPIGGKGKIVEADETFLTKSARTRRKPFQPRPIAVLSLVERDGGPIRSRKLNTVTKYEIGRHIRANVDPASVLHTDGAQHYETLHGVAGHEAVNHNREYVRRTDKGEKVHTNTLEGFFSVFKRGLVGTYQHISEQHTHRYLAEFDFRQNNRVALGVTDTMRAERAIKGAEGKRLTYHQSGTA